MITAVVAFESPVDVNHVAYTCGRLSRNRSTSVMKLSTPIAFDAKPAWAVAAKVLVSVVAMVAIASGVSRLGANARSAETRLDFSHYYVSAQYYNEGLNPYRTPLAPRFEELGFRVDHRIPYGANPPLLIRLVSPLASFPPSTAFKAWFLIESLSLLGLIWTVGRLVGVSGDWPTYLAMAAVFVNGTAVFTHFSYSQVQLLVAWSIALALLLHSRGYFRSSVALITLSAAFKLYPAVLIPWFLFSQVSGRRDCLSRLAVSSIVSIAAVALVGVEGWRSFVVDGLPVIHMSVGGSWTNYSLPSFTKMMAGSFVGDLANPPAWSGTAGKIAGLVAVVLAYARSSVGDLKPQASASLVILAMMTASLVCWSHYFVIAALPAAVIVTQSIRFGWRSTLVASMVAALLVTPQLDDRVPIFQPLTLRVMMHFYPLLLMGLAAGFLCRYGVQSEASESTMGSHDAHSTCVSPVA